MGFVKQVAPDHPCPTPQITDLMGDGTVWECESCGKKHTLLTSMALVADPPRYWAHFPPLEVDPVEYDYPEGKPGNSWWSKLINGRRGRDGW